MKAEAEVEGDTEEEKGEKEVKEEAEAVAEVEAEGEAEVVDIGSSWFYTSLRPTAQEGRINRETNARVA